MPARFLTTCLLAAGALGQSVCPTPVDIGYSPEAVFQLGLDSSRHAWEHGTNAQALLELYDPEVSVFSDTAFPDGGVPPSRETTATVYAKAHINMTASLSTNTLWAKGDAAGDYASLGVFANMLGQADPAYAAAATRQIHELLTNVPRFRNGAISHFYKSARRADPTLWAEFVYLAAPSIAYEAVATRNESLLRTAVDQVRLYRHVLGGKHRGLWAHVVGGRLADPGRWSTGNAWAAAGISRVLATVKHWPTSAGWTAESDSLVHYAKHILDGAIYVGPDASSGLLRNYITQRKSFPEAAGTALLAASTYRLAVLAPATFARPEYITAADAWRKAVVKAVAPDGLVAPVVNPYKTSNNTLGRWDTLYTRPSPEGQAFVVLLYTAYRDCICAGRCSQ